MHFSFYRFRSWQPFIINSEYYKTNINLFFCGLTGSLSIDSLCLCRCTVEQNTPLRATCSRTTYKLRITRIQLCTEEDGGGGGGGWKRVRTSVVILPATAIHNGLLVPSHVVLVWWALFNKNSIMFIAPKRY